MSVDGSERGKAATAGQASDPPKVVEEKSAILITTDAAGRPVAMKFIFFRKITTRVLNHTTEMWVFSAVIVALLAAAGLTGYLFHPSRILNPVNWVLAFSVYGGAFTGTVVSIIETYWQISKKYELIWSSSGAFLAYNFLNGVTGLAAVIFVSIIGASLINSPAPSEWLGLTDRQQLATIIVQTLSDSAVSTATKKYPFDLQELFASIDYGTLGRQIIESISLLTDGVLRKVVTKLAITAFIVIVIFSIADGIAYKYSGDKMKYGRLLRMDAFVVSVHMISLYVLHFSDSFPFSIGFATGPRDAFMGGCMAISLLLQSWTFAVIEARIPSVKKEPSGARS